VPVPDQGSSYQEIASTLRGRINTGVYKQGTKLPTVSELMREFRASNTAIQRATGLLKHEGLIVGRQGKGLFVRESALRRPRPVEYLHVPVPGEPDHWTTWATGEGRVPAQQLLFVGEVVPPADVAEAFGLAAGESVALRSRLLLLDHEPDQLAHSYYPLAIARGTALLESRRIKGGAIRLLAEKGLVARDPLAEEVRGRMPTPDEARLLRLDEGVPLLEVFRPVVTTDDVVYEVAVMLYAADRHALRYWLTAH
jgi:GntR family transcriptional regulator